MIIKPLEEEHLEGVDKVLHSAFPNICQSNDLPFRSVRASLNQNSMDFGKDMALFKNRRYWVAIIEQNIVGLVGLMERSDGVDDIVWLNWFGVREDYRKKGIGRALLSHAISAARMDNKKYLNLWTSDSENERTAQFLYDKMDFQIYKHEECLDPEDGETFTIYRSKEL